MSEVSTVFEAIVPAFEALLDALKGIIELPSSIFETLDLSSVDGSSEADA